MKRCLLLCVGLFLAIGLFTTFNSLVFAEEKKSEMKMDKAKMDKMLQESIAKGEKLFNDQSLGTSGKTCNSCHIEMGKSKKEGMMGAKGFSGREPFPKVFPMAARVMTLEQGVQFCIVTPLKGKPLAWDDQRLTDLTAYVNSIYVGK